MIIAVINTKGGTAKTTSAVFIAHGLAQYGKTLLIDADPQGSSMSWSQMVGTENFLPSTIPLAVSDLDTRVPGLAGGFSHVIIDTPPGEGSESQAPITESAIRIADVVLLPLAPTMMDLDRLAPTIDLLSSIERRYGHTPVLHVLLTKVRAGTTSASATRTALTEDFKLPVFRAEIPMYERYANAFGLPITDLGEYQYVIAELKGEPVNG
jgi:chromosome partitioning protein